MCIAGYSIKFSFKCLVIHKDVWFLMHLLRSRLLHDFCLLGADGKTKVVASSREDIHTLLHFRFSVAIESAVIRKEEFSQCGYKIDLCVCFESLSRLRLNTPPSVLYLNGMPSSLLTINLVFYMDSNFYYETLDFSMYTKLLNWMCAPLACSQS